MVAGDLRVLVVDDHPVNRLVLSELLKELGCEVSVAEDGAQALATTAGASFDLICLDRNMPGLSGDEVVERLPREQFVLAWSTDYDDLPARFNGVMSKPVSIAAVQSAMQRADAWRRRSAMPVGALRRNAA
jgi:CheY-like chemotaxis protein